MVEEDERPVSSKRHFMCIGSRLSRRVFKLNSDSGERKSHMHGMTRTWPSSPHGILETVSQHACTQNSLNVFYSKRLSDFKFSFKFCNIYSHIMVSWGWKKINLIVSYVLYRNSLRNPFPSIFSLLVFDSNLSWAQNFPLWDDMRWHPSFRFYCLWIGGFQSSTVQSIDIWKRQNCPPLGSTNIPAEIIHSLRCRCIVLKFVNYA